MKIAVLGDVHLIAGDDPYKNLHGRREFFKSCWPSFQSLLKKVNDESPDLTILLGDLVDWFSSENLSGYIKRETWNNQQIRIEENVHNILKMLDDYSVKATFFCLGWITNKIPKLISEISNIGHEIASHGYHHKLIYNQKPDEFKLDIIKSKNQLEDITGIKVRGYRAPTFSITDWSLDILLELGFEYDSSLGLNDSIGFRSGTMWPYKLLSDSLDKTKSFYQIGRLYLIKSISEISDRIL